LNRPTGSTDQGRSDGGGYRYPPKSAQVNFLCGKNDVRTAIQQFYTPKKTYTPQKKQISGHAPGTDWKDAEPIPENQGQYNCVGSTL